MEFPSNPSMNEENLLKQNSEQVSGSSNLLNLLTGLKLEKYYDAIVMNGGEKLEHLIYVDEMAIDKLCKEINMSYIHFMVFKKALLKWKLLINKSYSEGRDNVKIVVEQEQSKSQFPWNSNPFSQHNINPMNMQTLIRPYDQRIVHYQNFPNMMIRTPQNNINFNMDYQMNLNYQQPKFIIRDMNQYNQQPRIEPLENNLFNIFHPSPQKTPEEYCSSSDNIPSESYFLNTGERNMKFPNIAQRPQSIQKSSPESFDIIKRNPQIFGWNVTKPKNTEFCPPENFNNEISISQNKIEVSNNDNAYVEENRVLRSSVRDIVKDDIPSNENYKNYDKISIILSPNVKKQEINQDIFSLDKSNDKSYPDISKTEINRPLCDYDIIHHYKIHRKFPRGFPNDQKEMYKRKASNFELINDSLYYTKHNRKRKWLPNKREVVSAFNLLHINQKTGDHYSSETTYNRMDQKFYYENMEGIFNKLFLRCHKCRENLNIESEKSKKRKTSNIDLSPFSFLPNEINSTEVQNNEESSQIKKSFTVENENNQTRKPRKSIPKRLTPEEIRRMNGLNPDESQKSTITNKNEQAYQDNVDLIHQEFNKLQNFQ